MKFGHVGVCVVNLLKPKPFVRLVSRISERASISVRLYIWRAGTWTDAQSYLRRPASPDRFSRGLQLKTHTTTHNGKLDERQTDRNETTSVKRILIEEKSDVIYL